MDKDKVIQLINDLEAAVENLTYTKVAFSQTRGSMHDINMARIAFENAEIALLHELGFSN